MDSDSNRSVIDTFSVSGGGPGAGHNWLALATAASTSGELPSGREGSSSRQSSAAADELLVSGGAKSMRNLGRDFFLRRFGLTAVNLALGRPKAAPEQNAWYVPSLSKRTYLHTIQCEEIDQIVRS